MKHNRPFLGRTSFLQGRSPISISYEIVWLHFAMFGKIRHFHLHFTVHTYAEPATFATTTSFRLQLNFTGEPFLNYLV